MNALPAPRAIIFDWDNTLVDTWPIIHEALNATFAEEGMPPWTLEQVKRDVKKSMRDSFPALFGENWQEVGERYRLHYRALHLDRLHALPGAEEVLARVRALGLFSAVVSNKLGQSLRLEAEQLGWTTFFDVIIGSDDAARDKPHADPVHLAFEKSHIRPARDVWFIGDSDVDLECALATGCTAILYGELEKNHPEYTATHFYGFPYHRHVRSHAETLELLASQFLPLEGGGSRWGSPAKP